MLAEERLKFGSVGSGRIRGTSVTWYWEEGIFCCLPAGYLPTGCLPLRVFLSQTETPHIPIRQGGGVVWCEGVDRVALVPVVSTHTGSVDPKNEKVNLWKEETNTGKKHTQEPNNGLLLFELRLRTEMNRLRPLAELAEWWDVVTNNIGVWRGQFKLRSVQAGKAGSRRVGDGKHQSYSSRTKKKKRGRLVWFRVFILYCIFYRI